MPVRLRGSTSGYAEIDAPAVAGNNTLILPGGNGAADQVLGGNGSGTLSWVDRGRMTLATAQNTTSGTAIDFTGIPSWVKRVTVMFNGVSTNGTSDLRAQLGSGSIATTGYSTSVARMGAAANFYVQSTSGAAFQLTNSLLAADTQYGQIVFVNVTGNTWSISGNLAATTSINSHCMSVGAVTLSGTLDRVRITTVNGTDTFDAGSVNILYEG